MFHAEFFRETKKAKIFAEQNKQYKENPWNLAKLGGGVGKVYKKN